MFRDNQCIVTLATVVLLWLLNSHDAPIAGQNVVSFHSSVASHQNWVRVGSRTVHYEYDGVLGSQRGIPNTPDKQLLF